MNANTKRKQGDYTERKARRIAIIGSGFSGLCLGIQLKKAGQNNFVIFEKASSLGGTWRENVYPGAECDIPSSLYSFSFEPNPNWSHKWSEQPEILRYMEHCANKHNLEKHLRFNHECLALEFQEQSKTWLVTTQNKEQSKNGEQQDEFDIVVSGVGQLHKPFTPKLEGSETFTGTQFHSARWDTQCDLKDKTVNVIGNAASAVQFIPQIAPKVKQLNVFQRSANWILPKNDREYSFLEKWLVKHLPFLLKAYRFHIWFMADNFMYEVMNSNGNRLIRGASKKKALDYIKDEIDDPELRKKLVPKYPIGSKRVLFSDDIYQGINRSNVEVITQGIDCITPKGILDKDRKEHPCDVLIYATGFETSSFLTPMTVTGTDNLVLNELWQDQGAEAYLGITHHHFPNFFMMYGPNTNLGHNSIILMIEAQTRYILSCLEALDEKQAQCLEVKKEIQDKYNQKLQARMQNKTWASVDHSWYKSHGKITNNWAGKTYEYQKITRALETQDYLFN